MPADPRPFALANDEASRLKALEDYAVFDTPPEQDFDHLAALAARIFSAPISVIALVDGERQVFKARVGTEMGEGGRSGSLCLETLAGPDIFCVADARQDSEFATDPFVVDGARFFAGAPLITPTGHAIGALCVIDTKPRREFTDEQTNTLRELAGLVMDRLEVRRLGLNRNETHAPFQNIAATSPDGIVCANARGAITFWNAAAERIFGYTAAEVMGRNLHLILGENCRKGDRETLARLMDEATPGLIGETAAFSGQRRNGTELPIEVSLSCWMDSHQQSFGAIIRDVSDRRDNEARLLRLANHDALTDLPNRGALWAHLDDVLAAEEPLTLLMLDLDGFKEVNDDRGHMWGDRVLQVVARQILDLAGDGDMVARLGGDEFAVVLRGVGDPLVASRLGERLIQHFNKPVWVDGQKVNLGLSIGIAIAPAHGSTPEELMANVDLALYRAKDEGRSRQHLFAPPMRQAANARSAFEVELTSAHENGEFELFYQPQVRLNDSSMIGAEALLRWRHPERGLMIPPSFISVLDTMSIAADVGEWVIRSACGQAAAWREAGVDDFKVAVNLFGAQFRRGDLCEVVESALSEARLPAGALELEITETMILRHERAMLKQLKDLQRIGVGVAFDDYGTGFASLSQIQLFPLTKLKIDRSFVREMCCDSDNAAVVKAILHLGKNFGVKVIAEGIESVQQHEVLVENGCSEGQGFLYGRAMSSIDFEGKLLEWRHVA
ncbi:putative bifunctional diguanylate cyclase/phosphodiesterase [Flaviflagellibacter deserti]|uniref:Bifunctional diguanylate cyclase/phosphodiesterase n=1 Tax=Flaviflagellibacter deserti TaxID=2267266 RepID=A0ABV9YZW0_9HYPH